MKYKDKPYKDTTGKYAEAFRRLTESLSFKKWVLRVRKKVGIPEDGMKFKDSHEWAEWFTVNKKSEEIKQEAKKYCEKQVLKGIDGLWIEALREYVINGDGKDLVSDLFYGCEFVEKDTSFKKLKKLNHYCMGIFILPFANKSDVLRYIENNWTTLQYLSFEKHLLHPGRYYQLGFNGELIVNERQMTLKEVQDFGRVGSTSLFKIRKKSKANEHKIIYDLYKRGLIKSIGTADPKKAHSLKNLGLKITNSDNIRKIIYTQKKIRDEVGK